MNRIGRSAIALAAVAAVAGVANADTWDNSVVANPIVNNGITVDGNVGEWGTAGTNYTQFGTWNQWYDGFSSGYPDYPTKGTADSTSTTSSRMAIDTANNRLILAIQTTENQSTFEIQGLFGGTTTLHGQNARRQNWQGQTYANTGTQLWVGLPADAADGTSGTFTAGAAGWPPPANNFGGYEVYAAGAVVSGAADITGATGAWSKNGGVTTIELSLPVKLNWASADASALNTYDLNDLAGLVGGTGDGDLNLAYGLSMFALDDDGAGDAQNARFDGYTDQYGNPHGDIDYWEYRAVNLFGSGPDIKDSGGVNILGPDQYGLSGWNNYTTYGGLTLVGDPIAIPEPASLGLLGLGALGLVRRRKNA